MECKRPIWQGRGLLELLEERDLDFVFVTETWWDTRRRDLRCAVGNNAAKLDPGVHRIVVTVGTFEQNDPVISRSCTIEELLKKKSGQIMGISFFRTCWTRHVSGIFKNHLGMRLRSCKVGRAESVYGELEKAYKGPTINAFCL